MIRISQDACVALRAVTHALGGAALRISSALPATGDETARAIGVEVSDRPAPGDRVLETGDTRIFVAPAAEEALDGHLLDARVRAGQIDFVVGDAASPAAR